MFAVRFCAWFAGLCCERQAQVRWVLGELLKLMDDGYTPPVWVKPEQWPWDV
jgi:hypothetical protein